MASQIPRRPGAPERWSPFQGLSELVLIGYGTTLRAMAVPRHSHPGLMTVVHMVRGLVQLRVGDGEVSAHGGQFLVVKPGEPKSGSDDTLSPCEMYWLLLRLPRRKPRSFLGLDQQRIAALHTALWDLPQTAQTAPALVAPLLADLWQLARDGGPLASIAGRATLLRLLVGLTEARGMDESSHAISGPVAAAIQLMRETVASPMSVTQIARRVGLSPSHFHRHFVAEIGTSPGNFYNWQRIQVARRLLRETRMSIVEIALACGFTSSQYFAVCFQRQCGQTPTGYRATRRRG